MAKKTYVLLQDDLDGSEAAETVTFSLDGVAYELDLSAANATALRDALEPFAAAGRRVGGGRIGGRVGGRATAVRRNPGGTPTRTDPEQLAAIRAWARARGLEVNDRGRIPGHILEQYNTAASAPPPEPEPAPEPPKARRKGKAASSPALFSDPGA